MCFAPVDHGPGHPWNGVGSSMSSLSAEGMFQLSNNTLAGPWFLPSGCDRGDWQVAIFDRRAPVGRVLLARTRLRSCGVLHMSIPAAMTARTRRSFTPEFKAHTVAPPAGPRTHIPGASRAVHFDRPHHLAAAVPDVTRAGTGAATPSMSTVTAVAIERIGAGMFGSMFFTVAGLSFVLLRLASVAAPEERLVSHEVRGPDSGGDRWAVAQPARALSQRKESR